MDEHCTKSKKSGYLVGSIILVLLFTLNGASKGAFAQTAFTTHDGLKLRSLQRAAISDNGQYIAGVIMTAREQRPGIDHCRFGDPTYITPQRGYLTIIDTKAQKSIYTSKDKAVFRALEWSPDSAKLWNPIVLAVFKSNPCEII